MSVELPFAPIEWSNDMATGLPEIDKQHRYLVDTLHEANWRLLHDGEGARLSEIAHDLLNYAIMHFEAEEALMRRYGYEAACHVLARAHVAQHRDFSHKVVVILDQLREGKPVSRIEVLKFLNEWLRHHVLGVDQVLARFVLAAAGQACDDDVPRS